MPRNRRPRTMRTASLLMAAAGVAGVLCARGVLAQVEAIAVVLDAPSECPSSDRLRGEIAARTSRVTFAPATDAARRFKVKIVALDGGFVGTLVSEAGGVPSEPRQVRSESCSDVSSGLALMIAIAMDPRASTAPASALAVVSAPAVISSPAMVSASPPVSAPPALSSAPPPRPMPPAPTQAPVQVPEPAGRWTWAVGMSALSTGGMAPGALLGGQVFGESVYGGPGKSPAALRLSAGFADSGPLSGSAPSLNSRLFVGRFEGCPVGAQLHRNVRVLPCAGVDLGAIRVEGGSVPNPRVQTRWYSAVGLAGRVQWTPGNAFFLEGSLGGWIPLLKRTFVLEEPHEVVYEMRWIGWTATIGGGMRFL